MLCARHSQDNDVPLERIEPPFLNRSIAEVKSIASQSLMPITVQGDRQYYISPRHGYLLQKDVSVKKSVLFHDNRH